MNILESQVTDLTYLADSPSITTSPSSGNHLMSHTPTMNGGPESPVETTNGNLKKRKLGQDDGREADVGRGERNGSVNGSAGGGAATGHTRAKRNRYISIACNECKRRKIKCNGNTPCQRCGNLNLECQYAPNCCTNGFKESEEFRQMNAHLSALQEQVEGLWASLNVLRAGGDVMNFVPPSERHPSISNSAGPISPLSRHRPAPRHPSFRGPSSSAFSLDVAKNTLQNMGYQGLNVDEGITTHEVTPMGTPPASHPPPLPNTTSHIPRNADPLLSINKEEMIRLCRVYEEEMGIMYPVVDIEALIIHGSNLYEFLDGAFETGLADRSNPQGVRDEQSLVLKMVLACATVTEGNGRSEVAWRLFESVKESADAALHSEGVRVGSLPFLVLVAIYHFHCDEEALAWRIIGQVARMCIELGLHRRDSLFKVVSEESERRDAIKLFWSIYVLDRRWSFGTGLPFALQDADIDPSLPEPDLPIPYLNVMIAYSRIGSKVWRSICSYNPTPTPTINPEEINYLDYQIIQWQKSIPPSLSLPLASSPQTSSRAIHRLQILLYLRANQMRILIYRPVLHSASAIQEHPSYATTVIELAKDTIRALTHLNQTSDIYRVQQVCFNYFLISALAVLFLASCHAPVQFSSVCREEFYMALDLVKGFSGRSWVAKRLWKTIKGLKEVGPKLGLSSPEADHDHHPHGNNGAIDENPHETAALAMAGLAGHEISSLYSNDPHHPSSAMNGTANANSPMNGFQMSCEMTSLFEAALGNVPINGSGGNGGYGMGEGSVSGGEGIAGVGIGSQVFGGDEELYRQLRDLF